MEPEFYVRNRTGELMSRATNDLNNVRMVLGPGIMYTGQTLVTMSLAVIIMARLSPSLTLWVLLPVPVVAVAVRHFGKVIHDLYETIQASHAGEIFLNFGGERGERGLNCFVEIVDYFSEMTDSDGDDGHRQEHPKGKRRREAGHDDDGED